MLFVGLTLFFFTDSSEGTSSVDVTSGGDDSTASSCEGMDITGDSTVSSSSVFPSREISESVVDSLFRLDRRDGQSYLL